MCVWRELKNDKLKKSKFTMRSSALIESESVKRDGKKMKKSERVRESERERETSARAFVMTSMSCGEFRALCLCDHHDFDLFLFLFLGGGGFNLNSLQVVCLCLIMCCIAQKKAFRNNKIRHSRKHSFRPSGVI